MKISPNDYFALLEEVKPMTFLQLDAAVFADDAEDVALHETIRDDNQVSPNEQLEKKELLALVAAQLQQLPDMPKKIMAMYYFEEMRLAEIAAAFGLSEGRISQIHTQTVLGLRSFVQRLLHGSGQLRPMLLIVGFIIVLAATLGGFMIAGGQPMVLMHVSEFVVIGGISIGILVIASPVSVLQSMVKKTLGAIKGGGGSKGEYLDLMKVLYEVFMLARRNGLIALEDHVMEPAKSPMFQKYPSFLKEHARVGFLCNGLKPLIDGRIKPDQLESLLESEVEAKTEEAGAPVHMLQLIGDSLPGVGIVAAVLGIINTMAAIAEGPEKVGERVAAALTGTFLGILGAYGFINPLTNRIKHNNSSEIQYFTCIVKGLAGFATGWRQSWRWNWRGAVSSITSNRMRTTLRKR